MRLWLGALISFVLLLNPAAANELKPFKGDPSPPPLRLVDTDGKIRYAVLGAVDWDGEAVTRKIDRLLP